MEEGSKEQIFTEYLEKARQKVAPEKSYGERYPTIFGRKFSKNEISQSHLFSGDSLLVDNPSDFRLALKIIQRTFPWVTDEYIQETVEHETEHVEAGQERFKTQGEKVNFFYGIRF